MTLSIIAFWLNALSKTTALPDSSIVTMGFTLRILAISPLVADSRPPLIRYFRFFTLTSTFILAAQPSVISTTFSWEYPASMALAALKTSRPSAPERLFELITDIGLLNSLLIALAAFWLLPKVPLSLSLR